MKRCKHCKRIVRWVKMRRMTGTPVYVLLHEWNFRQQCGLGRDTEAEEEDR